MKIYHFISLCAVVFLTVTTDLIAQNNKGFVHHSFELNKATSFNIDVIYTIEDQGSIRIDSVSSTVTGWVFGIHMEREMLSAIQNWNPNKGELSWRCIQTLRFGSLYSESLEFGGSITLAGSNDSYEIVSLIDERPILSKGFNIFYMMLTVHLFLMTVTGFLTLFISRYGSAREWIRFSLVPLIGPLIYLLSGFRELVDHLFKGSKVANSSGSV